MPEINYVPVGYMSADDPNAKNVDYITLDGKRVERVIELNDIEGWLWRWIDRVVRTPMGERVADSERLTGTVRVYWRASTWIGPS